MAQPPAPVSTCYAGKRKNERESSTYKEPLATLADGGGGGVHCPILTARSVVFFQSTSETHKEEGVREK